MIRSLLLISALALIFPLATPQAHAKGEKIALIAHGGVGNPFWPVVFKGAKDAAKDLGVHLQILFPTLVFELLFQHDQLVLLNVSYI